MSTPDSWQSTRQSTNRLSKCLWWAMNQGNHEICMYVLTADKAHAKVQQNLKVPVVGHEARQP